MDIDFSFDSKKTRQGLTATLVINERKFLGKKATFTIAVSYTHLTLPTNREV